MTGARETSAAQDDQDHVGIEGESMFVRIGHADDDTCTHAGCSLADGELHGTTVTCACHGSQFDVASGAVLRGPARLPVRSRSVRAEGPDLLAET